MNLRDWQKKFEWYGRYKDIDLLLQIIEKQSEAIEWYWLHWGTNKENLRLKGYIVSKDTQSEVQGLVERLISEN